MKKTGSFAALDSLVYSTDAGRHCPECGQPLEACCCAEDDVLLGDGNVRVRRESKGRGGKVVTLVTGLPLNAGQLKDMARQLKQACGVGGAVKDGVVEIQGDQVDKILPWLAGQGYKAKKAGG